MLSTDSVKATELGIKQSAEYLQMFSFIIISRFQLMNIHTDEPVVRFALY